MDKPRRRIDPLALAVLSVAAVAVVGIAGYVVYRLSSDAVEATPAAKGAPDTRLADAVAEVRGWLESRRPAVPPPAPPATKTKPEPQAKAASAPPAESHCSTLPSAQPMPPPRAVVWALGDEGRRWRYNVSVDAPATWHGASLTYQMFDSVRSPIVQARFERGEKTSLFRVGAFGFGDGSHSYMRFPGFFMLPVYLDGPLQDGARFQWSIAWPLADTRGIREADQSLATGWMWALPQLLLETGRAKRYDAVLKKWEEMTTAMGSVTAACIEATVSYVEKGETRATVRETYWYAPRLAAVVKVVREGEAPDESARRITADLVGIEPLPFELVDARPPKDKMASDPGDGSVVAADEEFSPDRLALVRQHLAAIAGKRLAGKRVAVNRLVTWYVRTPRARNIEGVAGPRPLSAEEYFDLPQLRQHPYWVICMVDLSVDDRRSSARGVVGFESEMPDFSRHHRQALISAVNGVAGKL